MSQEAQEIDKTWLTIVTLRVYFQKSTFMPYFRDKLVASTDPKALCDCPRLTDLDPGYNARNLAHGLLPSDHFTARFIISGAEKVKKARQLCLPQANKPFNNAKEFGFWIRSLAIQMSELCESDHIREFRPEQRDFGIRPFKIGNFTNSSVCEDLKRLLNTPLNPSEQQGHGMGYVYVLRSQMGPSTMAFLKIGFSKFHPEHRAHELAQCLARPEVVSHTPLIPHAKRLESIIHTELQSCRKVQSCLRCHKDHQEWSAVSHADSREVLNRWSSWILQQPYVGGELTTEWRAHLRSNDSTYVDNSMPLATFWKALMDKLPRSGSDDDRSRRIGKYLTDCHWDVMCDQIGSVCGDEDFRHSLREEVPLGSSGTGNWRDELQASYDTLKEELRDLKRREDQERGDRMNKHDAIAELLVKIKSRSDRSEDDLIDSETLVSELCSRDTHFGRMFHPETKLRHLLNPDKSAGPLLDLLQRQAMRPMMPMTDMLKLHELIKTSNTGALSVSDPVLGVTESPLGDATMIPALAIKDLKYLNPVVANWVGMNPTNAGFQYVQEAYAKGKWIGKKPRFRLPKLYRRAGCENLSTKGADKASSSQKRAQERAEKGKVTPEPKADDFDTNRIQDKPSFRLTRAPDSDKFEWSGPCDENFLEKVKQGMEEIQNRGRANVERKFAKALYNMGIDVLPGMDEHMTDSDSFDSSGPSSSESDGPDLCAAPRSKTFRTSPAKRRKESSGSEGLINAKKAKLWLQSL